MTSKLEQILRIEPQNELKFEGKYNAPITSFINLSNPSDKRVMFKIKTTAPKKYCVRPNTGILEPSERVCISVCLQPFMYNLNEKGKHKFMVQSAYAPPGEVNMEQIWNEIIPEHLMDSKLKCVFEIQHEENDTVNDFNPENVSTPMPSTEHQNNVQETAAEGENYFKLENQKLNNQVKLNKDVGPTMPYANWFYFLLSVVTGFIGVVFGKYYL
ncbi:unnamed protein product [Psylliodes chrysocephalus]|uniref:MSP domain-containing protein n=1 Tax=Psylliodes chrysocephalus TaxID=3402493 RepID=A0A9P0CZW1_9CUCU|nr:unnamed protein product [Psylliodes chrysocephala]